MNRRRNSWKNYNSSEELIYNLRKRHIQKKFRRRRICVALSICLVAFLLVSTVVFASGDNGNLEYAPVAVESGDSLWSLACEYYPNMNIRTAISQIKEINGLTDSTIYEGDILMLPAIHG
ncbi:MAG: LysM peptidoglycan-binding domain-containing protein [Ruminococcaceae bacterium]|nr:LysM peptidoglycan-binding domain-containing protein [Oscillospiraceae bacterium]